MTNTISVAPEILFNYTALDQTGRKVKNTVRASDARTAARVLTSEGLTPLSLQIARSVATQGSRKSLKFSDRVAVLLQLALMIEAGVGLLEAVQTVSDGVESAPARAELEAVSTALKRGEPFAIAFEENTTGFPFYVHAMARVGAATGRLGAVLRDAADQMSYEDRLRRDFVNAMTYPGFLAGAGLSAVFFIFTQVVPRFATMIGDKRDKMPFISKLVIDTGEAANHNIILVLAALGGIVFFIIAAVGNPSLRVRAYQFGHRLPIVGDLLRSREIASWARLTSFALSNGVGLLEAAQLSRLAAPDGQFRRGLEQFENELKAGVSVDASLGRHTSLTLMDLSLLRAGQKSSTLPRMMQFVAESYDSKLKDSLKRATALIEPISIGFISILVGVVALSLVLALSSVYDSVF
jgi:general secretion pathway protein F